MTVRRFHRQRGVAIITALLLTTLAITIVASLFWQQQVQVLSIENQRLQLQKQWILRGALDWAELILREDARSSAQDHLGEPWAVPLAPTQLNQYVEGSTEQDAVLSGHIVDAQSRFNLTNLSTARIVQPDEVDAFARLLSSLQLDPSLAKACAEAVAASQPSAQKGDTSNLKMPLQQPADLLVVPGITPAIVAVLKDYVSFLPRTTPVNINTASPPVLAAILDIPASAAVALAALRERRFFRDRNELMQSLPPREDGSSHDVNDTVASFASKFFVVYGNVQMGRAQLGMQALIERVDGMPRVIALHEE